MWSISKSPNEPPVALIVPVIVISPLSSVIITGSPPSFIMRIPYNVGAPTPCAGSIVILPSSSSHSSAPIFIFSLSFDFKTLKSLSEVISTRPPPS